ncbi:MAG: efflux RND transporter periplasmic adaptor subunit [Gammaproteobacteria bacterium]|nr:efflux RND transporter periplasmic adaptor subunit [Gammaproteobacteria bacterium]NNC66440.1 efflux RND transporter periplasmic adaptor subunit [Gammaproteobacteria bacterium]
MTDSAHLQGNTSTSRQLVASLIAIATAVVLVVALVWTKKGPEAKLEELPPLKVVLLEVQRQDLSPTESLTGRLQPVRTAQLKFEVQGRVKERLVEPGVFVEQGNELIKLDAQDLQDQFIQSQSQYDIEQAGIRRDQRMLKLAKQNLELQKAEVQRYEQLNSDSLISASQLDAARQQMLTLDSQVSDLQYKVTTSKARVALKESERDLTQRNLERATLVAPFSGYVNEVNVEVGDYVTATQIVAIVVDTSSLDLQLDVRGEVVAALKLNQEINVLVGSNTIPGKLIALQPDPNISTNTHAIRIRLPGDQVQSGMLASADVPLSQQVDVLTVPVSAVSTNAGESFVYSYQDGVLDKLPVVVSNRVGSKYIIASGVEAGVQIVARDVAGLKDGQRVIAEAN